MEFVQLKLHKWDIEEFSTLGFVFETGSGEKSNVYSL